MSYLGVLDARLLAGFHSAAAYGVEAVSYASLQQHQLSSPFPYDLPAAWAVPPRSMGGSRRNDLRHAFHDMVERSSGAGVIVVRGSPLLTDGAGAPTKAVSHALQFRRGGHTKDCDRFLAAVANIRNLHENMGAFAIASGRGVVSFQDDTPDLGGSGVLLRAETHHALGHQPLRVQLTLQDRPARYWGANLTVHAMASRRDGILQIVSGHPRVVAEIEPLLPSLVGLVQYLNYCAQPFDAEGLVGGRGEAPLLTRIRLKARPPKRFPSNEIGDVDLRSVLASGEANVRGPLVLWAGKFRDSLQDIDRMLASARYVLLCETHTLEVLEATPHCMYRLSSGFESIGSPALRWAQEKADRNEEHVLAHGLRAVDGNRANRFVTLSTSGQELSMMVANVRLEANGRDAGVRFL